MIQGEKVKAGGMTIYGLSTRTSAKIEQDPRKGRIGRLWGEFMEHCPDPGGNKPCYGVYSDYSSGHLGDYTVTVGFDEPGPDDRSSLITVPDGRFIRFRKKGLIPEIVFELWEEIGDYFLSSDAPERAYQADYELYPELDTVEIYVGIKEVI